MIQLLSCIQNLYFFKPLLFLSIGVYYFWAFLIYCYSFFFCSWFMYLRGNMCFQYDFSTCSSSKKSYSQKGVKVVNQQNESPDLCIIVIQRLHEAHWNLHVFLSSPREDSRMSLPQMIHNSSYFSHILLWLLHLHDKSFSNCNIFWNDSTDTLPSALPFYLVFLSSTCLLSLFF